MKLLVLTALIFGMAQSALAEDEKPVSITELLNRDTITIDPILDDLPILAVTWEENYEKKADKAQSLRAVRLCQRFGFSKPIASKIIWKDVNGLVATLDDDDNFITVTGETRFVEEGPFGKGTSYYYATFTSLRCQK